MQSKAEITLAAGGGNHIDPEKAQKVLKLAIYILTAILGFFTGGGVQAATQWAG